MSDAASAFWLSRVLLVAVFEVKVGPNTLQGSSCIVSAASYFSPSNSENLAGLSTAKSYGRI